MKLSPDSRARLRSGDPFSYCRRDGATHEVRIVPVPIDEDLDGPWKIRERIETVSGASYVYEDSDPVWDLDIAAELAAESIETGADIDLSIILDCFGLLAERGPTEAKAKGEDQ